MTAMYDKLIDLMVTRFEVDPEEIRPGATFEDLEIDSLFLVELLLVVQAEIGVPLSDDLASPRDTIERAAQLIDEQVAATASAP